MLPLVVGLGIVGVGGDVAADLAGVALQLEVDGAHVVPGGRHGAVVLTTEFALMGAWAERCYVRIQQV